MNCTKRKILVVGLMFVVMLGFTGIVNANPAPSCGGNAVFDPQGIGSVGTSLSGKVVTYNVAAADTIIGLCVEETDREKPTLVGLSDPQSPQFWKFSHPDSLNHFSFERTDGQVALSAAQSADVGQADFGTNLLPAAEIYALHVSDTDLCTRLSGSTTTTCWIAPGPGQPVPELNPTILTITGLLGLVLVSRKYKKT